MSDAILRQETAAYCAEIAPVPPLTPLTVTPLASVTLVVPDPSITISILSPVANATLLLSGIVTVCALPFDDVKF